MERLPLGDTFKERLPDEFVRLLVKVTRQPNMPIFLSFINAHSQNVPRLIEAILGMVLTLTLCALFLNFR